MTIPNITEVIVSNLAPYGAGPTGPQGPSGSQGATGPAGVSGATGAQGATGIQGSTGPVGATGVQGSTGPQGATGIQGVTGPVGATGVQGPTGIQGATGPQGATGIGITGATGIAGASGDKYATTTTSSLTIATGLQYFTGSTGLAWSIGQDMVLAYDLSNQMNGAVTSYNSSNGGFSVNVLTTTGSGTYASWTINLDAAVGPQGATGVQGPIGLTGPSGATGPIGVTGATGIQGPSGSQGPTGPTGPIGETGPIGITGATGVQGPSGSIGPQGETGPIGVTGATGIQGPQGATGIQGATGPVGETGPVGVTGATGIQGPQGATGIQGATGPLPDTSSFAKTNVTNTFTATQIFEEDVTINATLTAERFYTKYVSSSIIYDSGSTKFGDSLDDTHQVTGSMSVTSSLETTFLTASGLRYPTTDGLINQVITTDGAGNLTFDDTHTIYEEIYTGEAVTKGDPLYVSGSQGSRPVVYKADAGDAAKMPVVFIALETVGAGANTRGIVLGLIDGLDLTGYNGGDEIFTAVGGGYTATRPTGSAIVQFLGVVTKGGSGGKGLVLNPGPFDLPNLGTNNAWIGDANGVPAQVNVGKFATTGSNTFIGDQTITGSLTVSSSVTIDQIVINDAGMLPIVGPFNVGAATGSRYSRNIVIGNSASFATAPATTASRLNNIVIGADVMSLLSGSGNAGINNNVVIGHDILNKLVASTAPNPSGNVLIGNGVFSSASLLSTTTGLNSTVAIGGSAMANAQSFNANTALGTLALQYVKGAFNVALGNSALNNLGFTSGGISFGDGEQNTAVGAASANNLMSGSFNVFMGRQSALAWRSGSNNVGIGYRALYGGNVAGTGSFNTALGDQALQNLRTGSNNIAIGRGAGFYISSSEGQLFIDGYGTSRTDTNDNLSGSIIYGAMNATPASQILRFNAQVITPFGITGSHLGDTVGTSSWASNAVSSSFATTASAATSITFIPATASFAETASYAAISSLTSVTLNGTTRITGSVAGEVISMSIASNTASFNAGAGSFYTLTIVSGSTTFVSASNIIPGRTMTMRLKQASVSSGSVRFASAFKFPTGSAYSATGTANGEDVISFITFDDTSIYAVATKGLS